MIYVGFIVILLIGIIGVWYGHEMLMTIIEFPDDDPFECVASIVMLVGGAALLYWAYNGAPFPISVHINFENEYSQEHK